MPGTLTISTLSDGTNSTSATNCISGSAKAWVRFTSSTGTISASYNVSSVTRNGTGDYTVNFTNALADANYSKVISVGWVTASTLAGLIYADATSGAVYQAPTTSAFRFVTVTSNNLANVADVGTASVAVFR